MSVESPVEVRCDPPYDLLLQANAVIVGPHQDGKTVLILQEMPGCDLLQMAQYAQWMDGKCAGEVREIAFATRQCQVPMSVEYLASSMDGKGRLYARHTCAQTLPRILRLLLYGATHKEVDISGAHYELIRAMCASSSLPSVRQLRSWLQQLWSSWLESANAAAVQNAIKLFPIRVINSGTTQAIAFLTGLTLPVPSWLTAFAYELEAARNAFTTHIKAVIRPRLEVEFRNRHFYAVEAVEGIVMQLFLLEVRKRCLVPSILWLHDGFWITKTLMM